MMKMAMQNRRAGRPRAAHQYIVDRLGIVQVVRVPNFDQQMSTRELLAIRSNSWK